MTVTRSLKTKWTLEPVGATREAFGSEPWRDMARSREHRVMARSMRRTLNRAMVTEVENGLKADFIAQFTGTPEEASRVLALNRAAFMAKRARKAARKTRMARKLRRGWA